MKILHISSLRTKANGIYSVLSTLSKEQQLLGNDVRIINVFKNNSVEDNNICDISSIFDFVKLIKEFKPHIVIFHSLYIYQYILFYHCLKFFQIPYSIQLHGALSQENYKTGKIKKDIANLVFYNKFIKKAKNIIYLNQDEYLNSIVRNINPQFSIIPNGCYLSKKNNDLNKQQDILNILYLGRISIHHKGLDILLDAIKNLINDNLSNKFHITLYGLGLEADTTWLINKLKDFPKDIISFKGPIYGKEKDYVFRSSHIFILTSRYEGMPMGILEALSYGLPCILTPGTNLSNEIEKYKAGWKTDLTSKDIAKTIKESLDEYRKNKERYIENAIFMASQYSWNKIAMHSINEYKKLLSK